MSFERENRYLVLKNKDIERYLTEEQHDALQRMRLQIEAGRIEDHREIRDFVVIESDWPEYERVWQMIEHRAKQLKETRRQDQDLE